MLSRAADRALSALAVAGALGLLLVLAGPIAGVHAYVVDSGSMRPTFDTGAVVLTHRVDVRDLHRGDVVSVLTPTGSRITHRLVDRTPAGLVLRGDANRDTDPAPYPVSRGDEVLAHVPVVGLVVRSLASLPGLLVLGLVLALLVAVSRRAPGDDDAPPGRPSGGRRRLQDGRARDRGRRAVVALSLAGVSFAGMLAPPAWAAPWTDPVSVTSDAFTASTLPAPVVSCGTLSVLSTQLTWTAVSGATGYRLHYGTGGATTETVPATTRSKTFTTVGSGTFWVEALSAYPSTTWVSVISNKKSYTVLLNLAGVCASA